MNRDYAERRIREALKANSGNEAKARQQIIAWALDDSKLLQELVAPHITGIVAHAVGRVKTMKEPRIPADPVKGKKPQAEKKSSSAWKSSRPSLSAILLNSGLKAVSPSRSSRHRSAMSMPSVRWFPKKTNPANSLAFP